jgi:large subunit ribosomal protein L28
MAAVCDICGRHPSSGMKVSHSHRRSRRRWLPNIQKVRAMVDGSPRRVHVCTKCLKAGKVARAV